MPQRDYSEPLTNFLINEGKRQGLFIAEIAARSQLDRNTVFRAISHNATSHNPRGINLTTLKKLARGVGGRIAVIMDDGRIFDPMRDQT